jgi:hypothetical protein
MLFTITESYAQKNLNAYKYVIVPKKFDFLKKENQYRLNELAQFLFNKYGFTALLEGEEFPQDLKLNRCLALQSNVFDDNNLFKTKLIVKLKNCNAEFVYTSNFGTSREKDYKTAYNLAMREAFKSFSSLNYKYEPAILEKAQESQESNNQSKEIQNLKKELAALKASKAKVSPQLVTAKKAETKSNIQTLKPQTSNVLYAQSIPNGFQLVDSSPKVVFKIKTTSLKEVYIVESKNAILFKKGNLWVLERYEGGILEQKVLEIKF